MTDSNSLSGGFIQADIGPGVRAFVAETESFRRTTVSVCLSHPLSEAHVAAGALLPRVLSRGSQTFPDSLALQKAQAALFGASLSCGAHKIGDRQVLTFTVTLPADRFVPEPVFAKGLDLLQSVLLEPAREADGGLHSEYVAQERHLQVSRIRALINQKVAYAIAASIREVYPNEPYGVYDLGTEESVAALTPQDLASLHAHLIACGHVDIYVVGPVNANAVVDRLRRTFSQSREPGPQPPPTRVSRGEGDPRRVVLEEQMEQAWLVLGYRSDIGLADPQRWALAMFNGILGGTTQSKLFTHVRERAQLAYSAQSFLDPNKGLLMSLVGIAPERFDQAVDLMLEQVEAMRRGEISDEEWQGTRRSLVSRQRMGQDQPAQLILTHLRAAGEGVYTGIDEAIAGLEAVTQDDVAAVADRLRLDTIFLLRGVTR